MGLMSHAEVKEIADKAILDVAVEAGDELEDHRARVDGRRIRRSPSRTTARTT